MDSYRRAIHRACDRANVAARAELIEAGKEAPERVIPRWSPHALRHTFATAVRKQHGIEKARILLGHRSSLTTELYAEIDRQAARDIMQKIG